MVQSWVVEMYSKAKSPRIRQGDIFRDIEYVEDVFFADNEKMGISTLMFPYVIVFSQDCDLESDIRAREKQERGSADKPISTDSVVESILICPAYEKTLFMSGQHLVGLGLDNMQSWGKSDKRWEILVNNRDPRYHFLAGSDELGINDMIIDFKHFYTIPRKNLYEKYEQLFVGSICELYREHLSQRFANFLSRIGLPNISQM